MLIQIVSKRNNNQSWYVEVPPKKTILWLKKHLVSHQYHGLTRVSQIRGLWNGQTALGDGAKLDQLRRDEERKIVVVVIDVVEEATGGEWRWLRKGVSGNNLVRPIKRVLCIDGGGVRGLAAVKFLVHLEEKLGQPLSSFFDLFAGTSTGSLISLSIGAMGKTAKDLERLYTHENFARMMPQTWKEKHLSLLLPRPKYDGKEKTEMTKEVFANLLMENAKKDILAVAYNLTLQEAWTFTNKSKNTLIADAVDASSAAPGLLPPKKIGDHWFIDGSVVSRDPTLCAYAEAKSLYGDADVRILSIGTGLSLLSLGPEVENFSSIDWLKGGIFEIFSNNTIIQKQAEILLGPNYVRVNSHLSTECDIDDYSVEHLESLKELGTAWYREKEKETLTVLLGPTQQQQQQSSTPPTNTTKLPSKPKLRHSMSYPLNIETARKSNHLHKLDRISSSSSSYLQLDSKLMNYLIVLLLLYFVYFLYSQ